MYTYRVLNKNDIDVKNNGIIAKVPVDDSTLIKDALTKVPSHLQVGSSKSSAWISTSVSLTTVSEHYAIPYTPGEVRTPLAVIDNCAEINKNISIFEPINNQKVIVNVSTEKELANSMRNLLICLSNGVFCVQKDILKIFDNKIKVGKRLPLSSKRNPNELIIVEAIKNEKKYPGIKYGLLSKEVVVLNKIDKEDIVKVLNPLEIDIAYAIAKYHELNNIEFDIEDFINNKINNRNNVLVDNGIEYKLFYDMYINCLFTSDIVKKIYEENNNDKSIDILEIYSYIKNIKRNIINRYLANMGYNLEFIPILEDYIYIMRIGNINTNKLRNIKTYCYNTKLPNVEYNADAFIDPNVRKTYSYVFEYQENNPLYALGTYKGNDEITDDIAKKIDDYKILEKINIIK